MDTITLFTHWSQVRQGLLEALDKLADAQLGFKPKAILWSLGDTVRHIAEAENGWFRHVVTHELSNWEEAEFDPATAASLASLKALLAGVHANTENLCLSGGDAYLARQVSLSWGGQMSVEDVVWHVLEHEIHHRGEVFLMLGILGIAAPDV